jgi:hypothetical protein
MSFTKHGAVELTPVAAQMRRNESPFCTEVGDAENEMLGNSIGPEDVVVTGEPVGVCGPETDEVSVVPAPPDVFIEPELALPLPLDDFLEKRFCSHPKIEF